MQAEIDDIWTRLFETAQLRPAARNVSRLRRGGVERVASERIGRETVTYVSNIYKYYITYRLISEQRIGAKRRRRWSGGASDTPDDAVTQSRIRHAHEGTSYTAQNSLEGHSSTRRGGRPTSSKIGYRRIGYW